MALNYSDADTFVTRTSYHRYKDICRNVVLEQLTSTDRTRDEFPSVSEVLADNFSMES